MFCSDRHRFFQGFFCPDRNNILWQIDVKLFRFGCLCISDSHIQHGDPLFRCQAGSQTLCNTADKFPAVVGNCLGIGNLLAVILDFIIVAFAMFLLVKAMNKLAALKKKDEEPAPEQPAGPTTEELLAEIRDLLKEQK